MASLSNLVSSLKLVLFSTGVLSLALALKLSVPLVSDFIVSDVPLIWSFLLTCLRPPYLYILVNCIIISIVATSKFQNPKPDYQALSPDRLVVHPSQQVKMSVEIRSDHALYNGYVDDAKVSEMALEFQQGRISNAEETRVSSDEIGNEEFVHAPSAEMTSLQRKNSFASSFLNDDEKSPVSARFSHRKAAKASPQGGKAALGVAKPKRHETLESTWRTITDGRAMPLTRHLKKSDTWDSHLRRTETPLTDKNRFTPPSSKLMKKSETFSEYSRACKENNSSGTPSPGSGKMRKESSPCQDELNRRVEAFIRKFNQEMRLQRQESLRQYREMINGGPR